ncbi:hypothetical protein JXB27_00060 [Candidatus Woesearchaeota archaeon]|nr:hypothetical protein [Candidatus Woesearchaeota archaeon]
MIQIPLDEKLGLWTLELKRLYELQQAVQKQYIPYSTASEKICRNFSITKHMFFETLFFLKEMGFIELSCGHGIRLKYEIRDNVLLPFDYEGD